MPQLSRHACDAREATAQKAGRDKRHFAKVSFETTSAPGCDYAAGRPGCFQNHPAGISECHRGPTRSPEGPIGKMADIEPATSEFLVSCGRQTPARRVRKLRAALSACSVRRWYYGLLRLNPIPGVSHPAEAESDDRPRAAKQ